MLRIASDFSLTPPAKSHQPPSRLRLSAFARRRSPHPAAKRFVQEAFRIGAAMRKALSIFASASRCEKPYLFSHRRRDAKSLIYFRIGVAMRKALSIFWGIGYVDHNGATPTSGYS